MTNLVNKRELSEILGKSRRTLTEWQKYGLPIENDGTRGNENLYNVPDVIEWMIQRAVDGRLRAVENREGECYDYDTERARLTHHQANKARLDESILRGNLIPGEVVERVWTDIVSAFRAHILLIPDKAAAAVIEASDLNETQAILKDHVYEALTELAKYEPEQFEFEPQGMKAVTTEAGT